MSSGVAELESLAKERGSHFFDEKTMGFFRSKVMDQTFPVHGGIYFVTSEQFVPSVGAPYGRRWTVRFIDAASGDINTVGKFQQYSNRTSAMREAKEISERHVTDDDDERYIDLGPQLPGVRHPTRFRRRPEVRVRSHRREAR